jgi:hypothetical protein
MPKNSGRKSKSSSNKSSGNGSRKDDWGSVMEMARERPVAAAAAAAGAAAAGVFLWSRRNQISRQIGHLSDQIGEMMSSSGASQMDESDDTAGLTESGTRKSSPRRTSTSGMRTGMSKTGGGNASLGKSSGGAGMANPASGRGQARSQPTT